MISSIFDGDGFWANQIGRHYLEPEYEDMYKPLKRFLEQRPVISTVTFSMTKEDLEEENLVKYVRHILTKSSSSFSIHYAMAWFFVAQFGLLPRCMRGVSKEKRLCFLNTRQDGDASLSLLLEEFFSTGETEEFELSPVVFCGALAPSEILDRATGKTSVVVFSYYGEEWNDDHTACSVTAYLVEFPKPIEPVRRPGEMPRCQRNTWEPINRFAEFTEYKE